MAPAVAPTTLALDKARGITTVVFVDVDGVLNIGAQDAGGPPLLLNAPNLKLAMMDWSGKDMSGHEVALEKLRALAAKELGHGDNCTYSKFVCSSSWSISDELVKRLAVIIRMAGDRERVAVVLASNWRRSCHASKVRKLEEHLGIYLGEGFAFDAMTAKGQESSPSDRLLMIGQFLGKLNGQREGFYTPLQALVIDDFFISDLCNWWCDGYRINSVQDSEAYLQRWSTPSAPLKAKVVYCVDTWVLPTGTEMRVGGGLTMRRLDEAVAFLLGGQQRDSQPDEESQRFSHARPPLVKAPSEPTFLCQLNPGRLVSKSCGSVDALAERARPCYAPQKSPTPLSLFAPLGEFTKMDTFASRPPPYRAAAPHASWVHSTC